jgi:hypothetical protein
MFPNRESMTVMQSIDPEVAYLTVKQAFVKTVQAGRVGQTKIKSHIQ